MIFLSLVTLYLKENAFVFEKKRIFGSYFGADSIAIRFLHIPSYFHPNFIIVVSYVPTHALQCSSETHSSDSDISRVILWKGFFMFLVSSFENI